AAYGQVFYSLSIMMAIMITYGSFLKKDGNLVKDTGIIVVADCFVSFLSGTAVFTTMGYMATLSGGQFVVPSGPTLTFEIYPMVLHALPGGPVVVTVFSIIFYLTLFTLAIDSAFSIVEAISTAVSDKFGISKKKTRIGICVAAGAVSLLFATKGGIYWLDIVDTWANSLDILLVGALECITIGWFFGAKKVRREFNRTSKWKIGAWYDVMIRYICPSLFIVMLLTFIVDALKKGYNGYPQSSLLLGGWIVSLLVFGFGFVMQFGASRTKRVAEIEAGEPTWDTIDEENKE
ncbi:MAG: hypothetical protein RR177_05155, partial [Oscillospiraceae bacterium]